MSKQICMFVWNNFTNDARVLRECTALSESGYIVDLICIDDPNNKDLLKFEVRNKNFKIHRVNRYPKILTHCQELFKSILNNNVLLFLTLIIWLMFLYLNIPVTLGLTVMLYLVFKTKLKTIWIRTNIFLSMIVKGLKKDYSIYHSNDLNTLPQGYICSKFRLKKRLLIYDSHEVQTSRTGYENKYYRYLEFFLIKKIDSMIVENHTRARYNKKLYKFYPNVIHNYPFNIKKNVSGIKSIREELNLPEHEKILLYQGGIQIGRGLDKLVEAVPFFKEGTLVFIGDGNIKGELQRKVNEMNLNQKVKFISKVPLQDLPSYTKEAFLGFQVLNNICFNHYSASSNKLFEYIMSNVPVISCNFPEIKKVVQGERVGICVDSHNPNSIAEGVNHLLSNANLYFEVKANCEKAKKKYNWDNEKKHLLRVYKSLII